MLSKPSSASSGSSSALASTSSASRSRIALAYSARFRRCTPTRPGCGCAAAAASSRASRPPRNDPRSAGAGRGRPAGGICPVTSLWRTPSHNSGSSPARTGSTAARLRPPAFARSLWHATQCWSRKGGAGWPPTAPPGSSRRSPGSAARSGRRPPHGRRRRPARARRHPPPPASRSRRSGRLVRVHVGADACDEETVANNAWRDDPAGRRCRRPNRFGEARRASTWARRSCMRRPVRRATSARCPRSPARGGRCRRRPHRRSRSAPRRSRRRPAARRRRARRPASPDRRCRAPTAVHRRRDVEDRQRLAVVEPPRQRQRRTADRRPTSGTARARCRGSSPPLICAMQAARIDDRADVADAEDNRPACTLPVSTSTSTSAKPTTNE